MRLGSLCSGYGGLEAGIGQVLDIEPVWCSEIDKGASKVLATHHPDVPNLGDLTVLDWHQVEPVDIICAGFPCQPFSHAGKRQGADDERAIFSYIADGISVLRPRLVVLENVPGLISTGPGRGGGLDVVATLAGLGYDCRWGIVRASDTGAPHRRARWFCIARNTDDSDIGAIAGTRARPSTEPTGTSRAASDTDGVARPATVAGDRRRGEMARPGEVERTLRSDGGAAADASGAERRTPQHETVDTATRSAAEPGERDSAPAADADGERGLQRRPVAMGTKLAPVADRCSTVHFGPYLAAIQRWERILGRRAPDPTDDRGLRPEFVEFLMGLDEGYICDVGLSRTAALKMLGNGVVPQQAALAVELLSGG